MHIEIKLTILLKDGEGAQRYSIKIWPSADFVIDKKTVCVQAPNSLKKEKKASQFPQYDFEYIPTIFKDNIRNHFEVLTLINRKSEELENELKEVLKNECEKNKAKNGEREREESKLNIRTNHGKCQEKEPKPKPIKILKVSLKET